MNSNFTFKWSKLALSFLMICCTVFTIQAQSDATVTITAPLSIAGDYPARASVFGGPDVTLIAGPIVEAVDTGGLTTVCDTVATDLTGNVALLDRGGCGFVDKVLNAQTKGAVAVIVCNNLADFETQAIPMGGDAMGAITIPSVMISYSACQTIRAELANGLTGGLSPVGFPPAANEICATATAITEGVHTIDTMGFGFGAVFAGAVNARWYEFTPATDTLITVRSCGLTNIDTRLNILGGVDCDLANLLVFGGNDDCDFDNADYASEFTWAGSAGTRYFINWDDAWSDLGFDFEIVLEPLPIVDVTVTVDMSNETVDPGGAYIAGAFNGWAGEPMTDNGDGTWSFTMNGLVGGSITEYKFQNGLGGWENDFVDVPCGLNNNRAFTTPIVPGLAVGAVCFNSCDACPPPACTDPDAIICDDHEMYTLSDVSAQAAHYTPWSGTPGAGDDATVSDAQAASGTQSLLISEANGDDMLLLLGDQTTGNYLVSWKMYIPAGSTGYFNTQKFQDLPGDEFGMQVEFFDDQTMTLDAGAADIVTVDWEADTWMDIALRVDLTNDWMTYTLNGQEVYSWPASWETFMESGTLQLGSINLYGNVGTVQYIDDVLFKALPECPDDAIICDSYEAYASGSTTGGQAPWWSTWSGVVGTAEDGIVSSDFTFDGANSMLIGSGGTQDVVLRLGDQTEGNWRLEWQMYIPQGNTGYFNIQEFEVIDQGDFNGEFFFNSTAANPPVYTAGMGVTSTGETFTIPEDAWFPIVHLIDLDNGTHTLMIDGNVVFDAVDYVGTQIGGIDFYSFGDTHTAYYDAVRFIELEPVVVDPDPVDVTFNVNMTQVMDDMGARIAGEFNGWTGESMTDDGDMTYSFTAQLVPGDTVEYKYQNGDPDAGGAWEDNFSADECGMNNNRFVIVGDAAMDVDLVCFNECVDCLINTDDIEFKNSISVFPNPATSVANIQYDFEASNDLRIQLTNSLGQQISSDLLNNAQVGTHQLNLKDLATGVYFIHITNGEQSMIEKLFVD